MIPSIPKRVHIVGVGGAGMSAIARVLIQAGHEVSGSDAQESPTLDALHSEGITSAMIGTELVIHSTAISSDHEELVHAQEVSIPVWNRALALAAITKDKKVLSVSGTHGKTTTTAMLTTILREAGFDPSFIVGGDTPSLGTNGHYSSNEWFVIEGDESDETFLAPPRYGVIVTNIESDHLDHYGSYPQLVRAFKTFVKGATHAVICADDQGAMLCDGDDVINYGITSTADWLIDEVNLGSAESSWILAADELVECHLPIPGMHNVRNATAALVLANLIGVSFEVGLKGLSSFQNVARRFDLRGEADGIRIIDDYAHHPTELRTTIATARNLDAKRVIGVFQPHRYSRTEALVDEFADSLVGVDELFVTEIYSAGESARPGVSASLIVDALNQRYPDQHVRFISERNALVAAVAECVMPGDVILTLGAGDITQFADELLEVLCPKH